MRKCLLIVISLLTVLMLIDAAYATEVMPYDSFYFGRYEQDNDLENGEEPIEWIVLSVQDGKALLISRYALDCQPYNSKYEVTTWAESSLRRWFQDDFYNQAFTDAEKEAILTVTNQNGRGEGSAQWGTDGGKDTDDTVFTLSVHDIGVYFVGGDSFKTSGTAYARELGAKFLGLTSIGVSETDWWLRSPGKNQKEAAYVGTLVHSISNKDVDSSIGVRPAVWVDLNADFSALPYERYGKAMEFSKDRNYKEAADIFETLGNYNNSFALAIEARYNQACANLYDGEYVAAIELFDLLGTYKDSQALLLESRYGLAVETQHKKDYSTAIRMYTDIGQYKDCMPRLIQCFNAAGIQMLYFDEKTAVNTGKDNGYSKSNSIKKNDVHFGWKLGSFLVSGYTDVQYVDQTPVFLKTLGDEVSLWFMLEQDIDCLNGNDKLLINADENGYNEYFGISKTNFGKGALLVSYSNYQNKKSEPKLYTNYLAATATTGANTHIELNEEGDYEIALNYEIVDKSGAIFNYFTDYSITFKFSIRNGNCMVYPFDVKTGAELGNTAITENGFMLDLARSRYLDINVKRSVLSDNGTTGIVEDTRFNRPAKDGDAYTQPGIYVITVKNQYTNEETVKTIFVGNDDLLQQYIANGFNVGTLSVN